MNHKSVDINQRIPLETLHVGLESLLNGHYSEKYILEQLSLEFSGENRLKKALRIVNKILVKSPLSDVIQEKSELIKLAIKKTDDRNVILIALLNSAFVFSFDTLRFLGKFLTVQEIVNRDTIRKSLSGIYGGNRATENAIDSVIPMFLQAGLIVRSKPGIYQRKLDLQITSPVTKQFFMESFKLNNTFDSIQEYQLRDPYFLFISD